LPGNAAGGLALLQKSSFVDHQYGIIVGQRFQRIFAHDVAQIIGTPQPTPQDRLLPPWSRIARRFCPHPARLASLLAQQAVQE
jgi:hypothetical protein